MQSNFLQNIYREYVLTPYSQCAQEISFKLHSFEMPWRFLGKWTNSNNHSAVTDRSFAIQICQGCTVDPKKKNLYWAAGIVDITPKVILIQVWKKYSYLHD